MLPGRTRSAGCVATPVPCSPAEGASRPTVPGRPRDQETTVRFQSLMQDLGTSLPEFSLLDPAGRRYTEADFAGTKGLLVAFICNHCPFVLHILDRFVAVANEFAAKG